jgi:CheY-like chemotaxis protein
MQMDRPSVLLVEDDKVNQKVIQAMLNRLGYLPSLVENGLEALKIMERHRYEIVLMDIMMPRDGWSSDGPDHTCSTAVR